MYYVTFVDYIFQLDKGNNFAVSKTRTMTQEQIKQFIVGGEWVSIAAELRPSTVKDANGNIKPLYCSRSFQYFQDDRFDLTFINYADPNGKVPLVKMLIKGHIAFDGEHPIAQGAYKLNYVADGGFEVTPLHQGFADIANKFPAKGINKWEVNVMQDVKGKTFPVLDLKEEQDFKECDLIYIFNDMLFNGSRNIDGRPFDKPENRPTNLQIPLIRKK